MDGSNQPKVLSEFKKFNGKFYIRIYPHKVSIRAVGGGAAGAARAAPLFVPSISTL